MISTFRDIMNLSQTQGLARNLVVPWPDEHTVETVSAAMKARLITPLFVGLGAEMERLIAGTSLAGKEYEIADAADREQALSRALSMMSDDTGDMLMQGGIPPQQFISAVTDRDSGIMKGKVVSFVSLFELLKRDKLILITDTYINNTPSLPEKVAILENALDVARLLDVTAPRVAALASIEQVNPAIPSTLDGAILSKMSLRHQFGDVVVEGPLDIDCALDKKAALRKGVDSAVTGETDIYLVPDIDVGYPLAQLLIYIGRMQMIGVVAGTRKPVIIDLPFVSREHKVTEIALAAMMCRKGG
jgi:phosphate butyryltransferase